ncbi:hypothetical protein NL676_017340 [Syzygium grande]|nr:hypothetical protein NL676_017340 [Syzygium grande]
MNSKSAYLFYSSRSVSQAFNQTIVVCCLKSPHSTRPEPIYTVVAYLLVESFGTKQHVEAQSESEEQHQRSSPGEASHGPAPELNYLRCLLASADRRSRPTPMILCLLTSHLRSQNFIAFGLEAVSECDGYKLEGISVAGALKIKKMQPI